jgi:hypothetical protein
MNRVFCMAELIPEHKEIEIYFTLLLHHQEAKPTLPCLIRITIHPPGFPSSFISLRSELQIELS